MDSFDNPQPVQPAASSDPVSPDDSSADDLRAKKIADLKKAIQDGTYHIDAEEVARKLIDHMLEPKD